LVRSGEAALIGPVRQEILSGIRRHQDFERVRQRLTAFVELSIVFTDYDQAAELFNRCRARGISPTAIDMLICSVAIRLAAPVFTTDKVFDDFSRYIPLPLHVL
jgi:predicted nucleic acid-binding protein